MPTRKQIGGQRIWLALAAITVILVLLWGVGDLLTGKAAPIWDATDYYAPFFSLIADHSRAARLLMWDPWIDGGLPDFAEPQIGADSPIILLFGLCARNSFHAFIAYWIAEWIFGAIGMLLLCRHLGSPLWGALIVSLGFLGCGIYTGHGEHTSITYSFSFLPWILWRLDVALLERDWGAACQAGVLWGCSALGGYPQIVILDGFFILFWTIGAVWLKDNRLVSTDVRPLIRKLIMGAVIVALIGIIGTLILSPSYYAFLFETRGLTFRSHGIDKQWAMTNNLPPGAFSSLSSPYLYLLNLPPFRLWPETDVSMSNIYCGMLVIVLAALAVSKLTKWRAMLIVVAGLFLCCSVGSHLPVRGWVYDFVPPTRYFRNPSLFAIYALLIFFVLAAYGARDVAEAWQLSDRRAMLRHAVIACVAGIIGSYSYIYTIHKAGVSSTAGLGSLQTIGAWLVVAIVFAMGFTRVRPTRVLVAALLCLAIYDAASTLYISRPTLYSPAALSWWKEMIARHDGSLDLTSMGWQRDLHPPAFLGAYPNNRNVVIKQATLLNDPALLNRFVDRFGYDPELSRFVTGDQRTWFSDTAVTAPATDQYFESFVACVKRLHAPILLLHNRGQMLDPNVTVSEQSWPVRTKAMVSAAAELVHYGTNRVELRYRAPSDGWLLITDRWAPGWSATVNGKPMEVIPADFIFRAIRVSQGDNTILFRYRSRIYIVLVVISWSTILLSCVIFGTQAVRRRRAALHPAE